MDDTVSQGSLDSASDEFVVVNAEPRLRIANNGDPKDLETKLNEVINDDSSPLGTKPSSKMEISPKSALDSLKNDAENEKNQNELESNDSNGQSGKETDGKASSDSMSPGSLYSNDSDTQGDHAIVFTGVTYLGSATVNAPRSEVEINRNMKILNEQSQMAIPVVLSVPNHSEGTVYLLDPTGNSEIASYKIHRILFCARGPAESNENMCFAFTCSHGDGVDSTIFQCHVFRCDVEQTHVGKILYSFATAFRRVPKSPIPSEPVADDNVFRFRVTLEFKEDDGKGNFSTCPKDKNTFKLRCDLEKTIVITVTQISKQRQLKIERCFGLLISPGKNIKNSDMHLIDMVSMGANPDNRSYVISGYWNPTQPIFKVLNTETPKDTRIFMTVAVDLVLEGIQEPVRFIIETKAKIFPSNERFWYFSKKPHTEDFIIKLKQCDQAALTQSMSGHLTASSQLYEVISVESQTEIDRKKQTMVLTLSPTKMTPQNIQTPQDGDGDESDGDEPILSGSGIVSKEVTDADLLESWHEALTKWHQNLKQRPKQIHSLVHKGIPEALRGEVWQLLVGAIDDADMLEAYRVLITKDSACEQVVSRDINRTFPAHDYFKETGGVGQDSLYKICKAYSVYDEEVGYCQGLSFLAAALLLHMPEEQAFCVLVKVMFDYGLRDLFKQGFEELHLKFYQLERLIQDQLPDLFEHFVDLGLEAHMYASQWFLTLFTAKFPLYMVFHILDLFLSEGMDTIFRVALALLKASRKDLLMQDFEGTLKYFRVQLPKKYRSEESAKELMQQAVSLKVNSKKLKKYEKEYLAIKEEQLQQEDPIERLERENQRLQESNLRLDQENDDLAHELVTSKIALRNDLDKSEDRCEVLQKELQQTKSLLCDVEEEKRRLETESAQLKEMCRRELEKAEQDAARNSAIIADYKVICSQLSERLEKQQAANREDLNRIKAMISSCESCNSLMNADGEFRKVEQIETEADLDPKLAEKDKIIRQLELELAQTKLALVESECKTQDLTHQLNAALMEIQESKNTWFHKTLTSIKEATNVTRKDPLKREGSLGALKDLKE